MGEIADCITQTGGTRAPTARAPAARALAGFLTEPLAATSQTDKEGGEEAVQGGAAEGWWGGGDSFPLPSQHHASLPSSDAAAADSVASTITNPAIAVPDRTLAIGSAFAGMCHSRLSVTNRHPSVTLPAAAITLAAASTGAHNY
jgi:hypothetical protein